MLRSACLAALVLAATAIFLMQSPTANAHVADCSRYDGVEQLRCERHKKMAEKCSLLKGDAHFACDREFLLANPLVCSGLKDQAAVACSAETAAFKRCEPKPGREFIACVKKESGHSPLGH